MYFFIGALFALVFVPLALLAPQKGAGSPVVMAIIMGLFMLFFYPLMGYLSGLIGGYLYNFISGQKGGIEVEFDAIDEESKNSQ